MNTKAQKRIANELKELSSNPPVNWKVNTNSECWNKWTIILEADVFMFIDRLSALFIRFPSI